MDEGTEDHSAPASPSRIHGGAASSFRLSAAGSEACISRLGRSALHGGARLPCTLVAKYTLVHALLHLEVSESHITTRVTRLLASVLYLVVDLVADILRVRELEPLEPHKD